MTDIILIRSQMPKIITSGGYLGNILDNMTSNLGKKQPIDLVVNLAKYTLLQLETKAALSAIDKFWKNMSGLRAPREGKGLTLLIPNEDTYDNTKIVTWNKKQEDVFLGVVIATMAT